VLPILQVQIRSALETEKRKERRVLRHHPPRDHYFLTYGLVKAPVFNKGEKREGERGNELKRTGDYLLFGDNIAGRAVRRERRKKKEGEKKRRGCVRSSWKNSVSAPANSLRPTPTGEERGKRTFSTSEFPLNPFTKGAIRERKKERGKKKKKKEGLQVYQKGLRLRHDQFGKPGERRRGKRKKDGSNRQSLGGGRPAARAAYSARKGKTGKKKDVGVEELRKASSVRPPTSSRATTKEGRKRKKKGEGSNMGLGRNLGNLHDPNLTGSRPAGAKEKKKKKGGIECP